MFLYLLQHGEAVPETVDPERPLTPQGRQDIERIGDFLAEAGVEVGRILHSGKLRTRMSADIIAAKLGSSPVIEEQKRIMPGDSPEWLRDVAVTWKDNILVIGHHPFMGRFVSRLVLGKEMPVVVDFTPGAIVCLARRGATGAWFISWMLTPPLLHR
ncbi:MAG: phosphohistidine phosphatase SixA [Rhodospirillales bacterium]